MGKSTHFLGQPILGQLLNHLNKAKILQISRDCGGERYVKKFNAWCHLTVMLYAVISRFDSLREITSATMMECRKLQHLGIMDLPRRSTLSDANSRRDEGIFGKIYMDLYQTYKDRLSSDSPSHKMPKWMKRLQIIDSTTVSLFSNLIFKGAGRNPKTGKKKGGIKVHSVIHANEGVPCDIQFTSAARHDHFLLAPDNYSSGDILTVDRAYIDYAKFEELTARGVTYVTKMKKNLVYTIGSDTMYMSEKGLMEYRVQHVTFTKHVKGGENIVHYARIIIYVDIKKTKAKLVSLLTNDMDMVPKEIVEIYRKRWEIELLFILGSLRNLWPSLNHLTPSETIIFSSRPEKRVRGREKNRKSCIFAADITACDMITYNTDGVRMPDIRRRDTSAWIRAVALSYGKKVGDVAYIFCSDERILDVNRQYLQHDYYTDVITFDYCDDLEAMGVKNTIAGDIFISLDTVRSNAAQLGTTYDGELHRVIIHGILHLVGLDDKGPGEREQMEAAENKALAMRKETPVRAPKAVDGN